MALLPNNNVYIYSYQNLLVYWDSWHKFNLERYLNFYDYRNTAKEDINFFLEMLNGRQSEESLSDYITNTAYYNSETKVVYSDERAKFFEDLEEYFSDLLYKTIVELDCVMGNKDLFFTVERNMIFVLDRRRMVYVPRELFSAVRQIESQCPIDPVEWV